MRFLLCLFGFSLLLPAQNVLLTSGVAAPFSFPAVNTPTIFYRDFGYRIEVPAGATRLEVRLGSIPSSVQFAIALRFGQDITNPPLSSDYPVIVGQNPLVATNTSSPPLRAGTYYIGIAVISSPVPVTGSITATVTTSGGASGSVLSSGVPAPFSFPAISTPTVFVGQLGYRVEVPANATRLEIRLDNMPSGVQFAIALRFGQDIVPSPLTADYPVIVGQNSLVVTTSSSPPLRAGTYFIGIVIVSSAAPGSGTITATLSTAAAPTPVIGLSATSLAFTAAPSANPPNQTFTVRNTGTGTLNFQVSANQPWLSASPATGSSTAATVAITAAVNVAGLAVGTHTGEIRVTGGGSIVPATVAVQLTIAIAGPAVTSAGAVNAASSARNAAAELILSLYGSAMASTTAVAQTTPLPTTLAGTSVRIRDSAGVERLALLFFVSPSQINLTIPEGTAPGAATLTVTRDDGRAASATIQIDPVAPGLFSANADGRGVAAALAIRVTAAGEQIPVGVFECPRGAGSCVGSAMDLGDASEQLILLLFGTGIRGRSGLPGVRATVGGANAEVLYAGPQGAFVGLDQVNVRIPRSLLGRGEVDVILTVDGKASNTVTIRLALPQPPRISTLEPNTARAGQTISDFTITGENLGSVTRIEFTSATGITLTNLRTTSTSVTAQLAISVTAATGTRTVAAVNSAGRSNTLTFTVTAPNLTPVISRVDPANGRPGQTVCNLRITGESLGFVNSVVFDPPGGIGFSNLNAFPTSISARLLIADNAVSGERTIFASSPTGGRSNGMPFTVLPRPSGAFVLSNLRAGPSTSNSTGLTIPITVDFTDSTGAATTGSLRMNFNLNNCNVEGFTSVNPTGVTPGQTSGTMQINFFFPQLRAPAGNTLPLSFWLTTSQGVESNIITGTFLSQ